MSNRKTKKHTISDVEPLSKSGKTAKNVAAAATLTGLPTLVIQAARDKGCPAFKENGNIDCELLLDYVAEHAELTEGVDHSMDPRVQKCWDLFESRMSKRHKRLKESGQLISREKVKHAAARNVIACKTKFYAGENAASVEIGMKLGLSSDQVVLVKEILMKHNRLAIRELYKGELGEVTCPGCKMDLRNE